MNTEDLMQAAVQIAAGMLAGRASSAGWRPTAEAKNEIIRTALDMARQIERDARAPPAG